MTLSFFLKPEAGTQSTVGQLEEAVTQCKHMYLAARDKPKDRQKFLLKRLIELRKLLHSAKVSPLRKL